MNLKPFFCLEVKSEKPFARNDKDTVVNLIITSNGNQKYFLKEVQGHSMRVGLDDVYLQLNLVNAKKATYILPSPRHDDSSKFLFEKEGKNFLLFPYVEYLPFSISEFSLNQLWNALDEFHELLSDKKFAKQDYRTYKSWLSMGALRLQKKFGEDLPFLKSFNDFLNERFDNIQFVSGPIHWDIHKDNLGLSTLGHLVLLDFDLVQEGTYAQDLIAAAAIYVDWKNPIEENFMNELWLKVSPLAKGLQKEDLKFLLARNVLGDLALEESKGRVIDQLNLLATAKPKG